MNLIGALVSDYNLVVVEDDSYLLQTLYELLKGYVL